MLYLYIALFLATVFIIRTLWNAYKTEQRAIDAEIDEALQHLMAEFKKHNG